jgi:ABC-type branched-subunit amino acid transport system substrate-binding protein
MPVLRVAKRLPQRTRLMRLSVIAATILLACAVSACSSDSNSSSAAGGGAGQPDLTFALIGDLTGPLASTVSPGNAGALTAIAQINASGGIDGRQIKVAGPFDSQSTPQGGASSAEQALSANPDVIIDTSYSTPVTAGMPMFKQADIPVLTNSAGQDTIIPPIANHFTLGFIGQMSATALYTRARLDLGSTKLRVAFIGIESPAVDPVANAIQTMAGSQDATVVDVERTPVTLTSFASQAARIVSSKANAVFMADQVTSTVLEVQALRIAGYTGRIYSTFGPADTPSLQKINDPDFTAFRVAYVPSPGDPLYQAAQKEGVLTSAESSYFGYGYALPYIAKTVLSKCGLPCSTSDFSKTAETIGPITVPDHALFGPVQFTASRHAGITAVQFYKWDAASKTAVPYGGSVSVTG